MTLRPLVEEDVEAVTKIAKEGAPYAWNETVFRDCLKPNYFSWVWIENQKILGFVVVLMTDDSCELMNIAVSPASQRRGYASLLLQHAIDFSRAKGIKRMWLEVRSSNQPAINLYKKFGGTEISVRKNYYPALQGREEAIILEIKI